MDFHIHGGFSHPRMDVKKKKSTMDFFMLREKQVVSEGKTARIHHGFAWIRFLREKQAVSEGKRAHTPMSMSLNVPAMSMSMYTHVFAYRILRTAALQAL